MQAPFSKNLFWIIPSAMYQLELIQNSDQNLFHSSTMFAKDIFFKCLIELSYM